MSNYSAQQSSISENNRSRILQYLYHNGICSRAQIAKAVGLTPAAITKITAKLLAQNIIEETGDMEGDKNRRSIGLNLNCGKYHVIGLKFARSLVQIGLFDLKCNRISLTDLPTVSEEDSQTDSQHHSSPHHQRRENRGSRHGSPRTIPCRRRAYRTRLLHAGLAQSQFHQGIQRSL